MNQKFYFAQMLRASPKSNKSLGTCEPKWFLSVEPVGLKSQVDPTLKIGGKVIKFHPHSIDGVTYVFRSL